MPIYSISRGWGTPYRVLSPHEAKTPDIMDFE